MKNSYTILTSQDQNMSFTLKIEKKQLPCQFT